MGRLNYSLSAVLRLELDGGSVYLANYIRHNNLGVEFGVSHDCTGKIGNSPLHALSKYSETFQWEPERRLSEYSSANLGRSP